MAALSEYLSHFNLVTIFVRLALAMACGGVVGIGRSRRNQNAGLRTFMLTAVGACLAVLLTC